VSGFWHENEELVKELESERTHSALSFAREAVLFWLAAWDRDWGMQEQWRFRTGGLPPFLAAKTREEVEALGYEIEPEPAQDSGLVVVPNGAAARRILQ
jgi:hypothetical protein